MSLSIAHVVSSLGRGGQERVIFDLAHSQSDAGHRVTTFSLAEGGSLADEFTEVGLPVVVEPKRGDGYDLSLARRLRRRFASGRYDLVHTHNPMALLYAALPARIAGAALVHSKHGINPDRGRRLWLRRAAGLLVNGYVAVSEPTAEVARANRECRLTRLRVIDNGIDLSRFSPSQAVRREVRAELGIPDRAFVVGTVGRLAPEKAHLFLLRAMAPILDDDLHVLICGDGPMAEQVAKEAAGLGRPDCVHLTGLRSDVPRVLAALDLFVLTSTVEGLPLVIPEAMATELPVVATAVGGVPRVVVEGQTGHLVDSGDEEALRSRIADLWRDPERRQRLGRRARTMALENYSAERMAAEYMDTYQEALGRRVASPRGI